MADGFDAGAAAGAIDMDALYAATPDEQRQMLSKFLRPKICAIQPHLCRETLEQCLQVCSIDELVHLLVSSVSPPRLCLLTLTALLMSPVSLHISHRLEERPKLPMTTSETAKVRAGVRVVPHPVGARLPGTAICLNHALRRMPGSRLHR